METQQDGDLFLSEEMELDLDHHYLMMSLSHCWGNKKMEQIVEVMIKKRKKNTQKAMIKE